MTQELPMTAWLAELDVKSLTELLFRRRESLVSIPFGGHRGHNFHSLAAVLQDPWSLTLVLPALSLPAIQLIEAHLALGASVPITSLAGLLAKSGDPEQQRSHVVAVVETLATCGVAWSDDGVISHLASGFDKLVP